MNISQEAINQAVELGEKLLSGIVARKYQGKQVAVMGHQVVIILRDDQKAATPVEKLEKQDPDQISQLISVPCADPYIL